MRIYYRYENGKKRYEGKFNNCNGVVTSWDGTGKKLDEQKFIDGTGIWKQYFIDGKINLISPYKGCKKNGIRTEWNEKGEKIKEETYKDGEVVNE